MTKVTANTQADKSELLASEFENMQNVTNKDLQMRADRQFIDPNSLKSDVIDQKITACARLLASNNQLQMAGRVTEENNRRSRRENLHARNGPLVETSDADRLHKREPVFLNLGGQCFPGRARV